MRAFQAWDQVKVVGEKLADVGRFGVVGDVKEYPEDEAPVKLDGDSEETVFKTADLKAV